MEDPQHSPAMLIKVLFALQFFINPA